MKQKESICTNNKKEEKHYISPGFTNPVIPFKIFFFPSGVSIWKKKKETKKQLRCKIEIFYFISQIFKGKWKTCFNC